ncbi:MAG: hypothetical protein CMO74_13245 [Verrucomicrobiales bacterium]|nr:hypothetical protein [Verrucomicrobiales bacterium]|tara:strand:+ start:1142 stop:1648 length:507 start_codon:yes stop_codon:yes gene_type:complete
MRQSIALLLISTLASFAEDKPKKPIHKVLPPPAWLEKAEDSKSPSNPFARGIYSIEAAWQPLFKPSGTLAAEVKMKTGHVLRVYKGNRETMPPTPASLEILKEGKRIFCARGHKFFDAASEDVTGDKVPDIIKVTHSSNLKPISYNRFIFTFYPKFRVHTIGPFVNEK